jgi:uncharacterized membrane protein
MISVLVALVVAGVLLYLLNVLVPMDGRIKTVINVLVCLFLFLYILQVFGIWHGLPAMK